MLEYETNSVYEKQSVMRNSNLKKLRWLFKYKLTFSEFLTVVTYFMNDDEKLELISWRTGGKEHWKIIEYGYILFAIFCHYLMLFVLDELPAEKKRPKKQKRYFQKPK